MCEANCLHYRLITRRSACVVVRHVAWSSSSGVEMIVYRVPANLSRLRENATMLCNSISANYIESTAQPPPCTNAHAVPLIIIAHEITKMTRCTKSRVHVRSSFGVMAV